MALKSKDFKAARADLDANIERLERNERENNDFAFLSKVYKEEYGDTPDDEDGRAWRVVLHLLNRMRRLEKRVRELEGD